jgi:hypothetical protein
MKDLLWIYVIGLVVTKWAVRGSSLDTSQNVIEWPLAWLNNPDGMFNQLQRNLQAPAAASPSLGRMTVRTACDC